MSTRSTSVVISHSLSANVVCWYPLQTVWTQGMAQQNIGAELAPNCLTLKDFVENVQFEKNQQTTKKHAKTQESKE